MRFQKFEKLKNGFADAFCWAEGGRALAFLFRVGDAAVGGDGVGEGVVVAHVPNEVHNS